MDKIKDIAHHILDEIAHGLTSEDTSRGRLHKTNEGAALRLYQRTWGPVVRLYVEHPMVVDPVVTVTVDMSDSSRWSVLTVRCDSMITPKDERPRFYPIARPSHGIKRTVATVRDLLKLCISEAPPEAPADDVTPPDPWADES